MLALETRDMSSDPSLDASGAAASGLGLPGSSTGIIPNPGSIMRTRPGSARRLMYDNCSITSYGCVPSPPTAFSRTERATAGPDYLQGTPCSIWDHTVCRWHAGHFQGNRQCRSPALCLDSTTLSAHGWASPTCWLSQKSQF